MRNQSPKYVQPTPADALSEILQDFRISGVEYGRCELSEPWGIGFPRQELLRFHFVSVGVCWIFSEMHGWQELKTGDLVLLPREVEHRLSSSPSFVPDTLDQCAVNKLGENISEVVHKGTGNSTTLFCGSMSLGAHALSPLIGLMPPIIKGCDVAGNDPFFAPLLTAMAAEVQNSQMGSATLLSRMGEILVARLIRCWVNCTGASTTGWLAAIRDPSIGRSLVAMHRNPGHAWTIEALANVAGQSRSTFSERFSSMLGEGAAKYLVRLRMQHAHDLLLKNKTVAEVASELGYESEASFARAFKRTTNFTPGALRRRSSGRSDMIFGQKAALSPIKIS